MGHLRIDDFEIMASHHVTMEISWEMMNDYRSYLLSFTLEYQDNYRTFTTTLQDADADDLIERLNMMVRDGHDDEAFDLIAEVFLNEYEAPFTQMEEWIHSIIKCRENQDMTAWRKDQTTFEHNMNMMRL